MSSSETVRVELSQDQALVLYDGLSRFGTAMHPSFEDQAEQRIVWDLAADLESQISVVVASDYRALLAAARERVRDPSE